LTLALPPAISLARSNSVRANALPLMSLTPQADTHTWTTLNPYFRVNTSSAAYTDFRTPSVHRQGQGGTRREDAQTLCGLLMEWMGEPSVMWGARIVGFGCYRFATTAVMRARRRWSVLTS
jgi:hypothetical protein